MQVECLRCHEEFVSDETIGLNVRQVLVDDTRQWKAAHAKLVPWCPNCEFFESPDLERKIVVDINGRPLGMEVLVDETGQIVATRRI